MPVDDVDRRATAGAYDDDDDDGSLGGGEGPAFFSLLLLLGISRYCRYVRSVFFFFFCS